MSQLFSLHPDNPQPRLLKQAAERLRAGELVVMPTDASYVLACHIGDKAAMERLRRLRANLTRPSPARGPRCAAAACPRPKRPLPSRRLHRRQLHGVVEAHANPTHRAVTLQPEQPRRVGRTVGGDADASFGSGISVATAGVQAPD